MGHLKYECLTLKDKGLLQGGCLNSPSGLERHSPTVQPTVEIESTTEEKEADILVRQTKLPPSDPWAKLVGRANEDHIVINGHPVTAAKLALPMGSHTFEVEALLLVLPTTDYQNRVPVAIGITVTDMVVDYIS